MIGVPRVIVRLHRATALAGFLLWCLAGPLIALPVLRQVSEIRKLSVAEARQGFPVQLRGVVTYFDTIGPDFFFQDASGGIWVHWIVGQPTPEKGDLLELEGVTTQSDF